MAERYTNFDGCLEKKDKAEPVSTLANLLNEEQVPTCSKMFHAMEQRMSAEDMRRIREAYALAAEAHKGQKRKTGEPYIIHP